MRFEKIPMAMAACIAISASTSVSASPDWGTMEQARVCTKEFTDTHDSHGDTPDNNAWGGNIYKKPKLIDDALASGKVSAECKTEVERRAGVCMTSKYRNAVNLCNRDAVFAIFNQLLNDPVLKKKIDDEANAKKAADDKAAYEAKIAKVELPKPEKKDAAIEKQIAAAYKEAYPDNVILMVILQSKDWTTERSNYGVITNRTFQAIVVNKHKDGTCQLHNEAWSQEYIGNKFTGKLSQRGAGSQSLSGILCEKVPGAKGK